MVSGEAVFGFDVLVNSCYNSASRSLIAEAVKAYHAGVFRGAIVLCWNAIVIDFEEKLVQLESVGDSQAGEKLEKYRNNRDTGNFTECNRFEDELLSESVKFEIISNQEKEILDRIKRDRNKSAHPGFLPESDESIVLPELARSHLTNALRLYLNRSPFFSKRATNLIDRQANLELFGHQVDQWEKWLKSTGLINIRENSIKGLCSHLVFNSLENPSHLAEKYKNALSAYLHIDNARWANKAKEKFLECIDKSHQNNSHQDKLFWLVKEVPQLKSSISQESWEWLKSYALEHKENISLWTSAYTFEDLKKALLSDESVPLKLISLVTKIETDRYVVTEFLINQYTNQHGYGEAARKGIKIQEYVDIFKKHPNLIDYLVSKAKNSPGNSIFGSNYYGMDIFRELAKDEDVKSGLKLAFNNHSIENMTIFDSDAA